MTRAAFQASFSDFRLVKSRKIAQFVLEVPLEGADAALAALGGLPRPDQEAWVAVARIDSQAAGEAHKADERGCSVCDEIVEIMQTYREQEASDLGVDTPGGLEHMGDVWRLLDRWDEEVRSARKITAAAASEAPKPNAAPKPDERERRAWNDLPAVQQAGIRCNEKAFWRFLKTLPAGMDDINSEAIAAWTVRLECGVSSRSALLPGTPAELRWQAIEAAYQNWLASEKYAEVVR